MLVGKVVDLADRSVRPESKEVFPDGNTSSQGFSVRVAINVHVEEVIEMLAYSDRGVGSLMALVTGIVIAYNVAIEPMAVAPLPKPAVSNSEISLIEFLCRSDLLVSVYDSDVDVV